MILVLTKIYGNFKDFFRGEDLFLTGVFGSGFRVQSSGFYVYSKEIDIY